MFAQITESNLVGLFDFYITDTIATVIINCAD
jgi:hypothetical protein